MINDVEKNKYKIDRLFLRKSFVYFPYIFFFILTFLIVFPLWQNGFLFLFDWGISSGHVELWQHSFAQMIIIYIGNLFSQYALFQKTLCSLMLFFLGIGGFLFVQEVIDKKGKSIIKSVVACIWGTFIMINPFVYARMVDGQWYVIMGMISVCYVLIFLLRWTKEPVPKNAFAIGIFTVFGVMLSHHALFFILTIFLCYFVFFFQSKKKKEILILIGSVVFATIILNSNIILGHVQGISYSSKVIDHVDEEQLSDFSTKEHVHASVYINTLSFHGYWGEKEHRFISTQENVYVWKPIFFIFFTIFVAGLYYGRKERSIQFLLLSGGVSYVLALGTNGIFESISIFLYENVPFYIGLREPHKWIGIFVLSFSGIASFGFYNLILRVKNDLLVYLYCTVIFLSIFLYTPVMLFAFSGQMLPKDFPSEWYDAREYILREMNNKKIIVLPWEQYLKMDFLNGKKIANPSSGFFGKSVSTSDDLCDEKRGVCNKIDIFVRKYFFSDHARENCDQFKIDMMNSDIEGFLLLKTDDFERYMILDDISCMKKTFDQGGVMIYEVE